MKRAMIALIIMIPLSSVLLGILMFYLATTAADGFVAQDRPALSKTSWQEQK
jgi:hypothetical protein